MLIDHERAAAAAAAAAEERSHDLSDFTSSHLVISAILSSVATTTKWSLHRGCRHDDEMVASPGPPWLRPITAPHPVRMK